MYMILSHDRFVKMSSPRMNNVIVTGCLLCYAAGVINGIDGNFVGPSVEALLRCWVTSFLHESNVLPKVPISVFYNKMISGLTLWM